MKLLLTFQNSSIQKMMKKQLLLIAATSVLTAFSGSPAQAQTTVTPIYTAVDTPKFLKGSWYSKTIRWNGEFPRVTWSEALVHLKGDSLDYNIYGFNGTYNRDEFEIRNYGGFLPTSQDGQGKPANIDSFTYVYQQTKTSARPNVFAIRVSNLRGQERSLKQVGSVVQGYRSAVAEGKVGLMLRSTLECDSPYVMIALTNEEGPQLSVRDKKGGAAVTVPRPTGATSFTDYKYKSKYADIQLSCDLTYNVIKAYVQYEGQTEPYLFGEVIVKNPSPSYYVGLAAAANTSADSRWSTPFLGTLKHNNNKDPQGRTYKQWQGGDLASFYRLRSN
jgi:hypothetical protein